MQGTSSTWRVECSGEGVVVERYSVQACTNAGCLVIAPLKDPLLGFGLAYDKAK